MPLNVLNTFLLLGIMQGFFLTVLIFQKRHQLFANYFLSALIFSLSLVLLNSFLVVTGTHFIFPYSYFLIYFSGIPYWISPLYYLYTRRLIFRSEMFNQKGWPHLLPFIIYKLCLLPLHFGSHQQLLAFYQNKGVSSDSFIWNYAIFDKMLIIQGIIYIILSLKLLKSYAIKIKQTFSSLEKTRLKWLQYISYAITVLWGIFVFESQLSNSTTSLTLFLITVQIYIMGYIGLSKSTILSNPEIHASLRQTSPHLLQKQPLSPKTAKRYKRSGLSPEIAHKYIEQLQTFMEKHKPYRNNELTLNQLAKMVHISPHYLSEIINLHLEKNFFDFINQYRLEDVKKALRNPQKEHLTILAIAMEAGFNSKTTFNTFFKKHTRISPSAYRKSVSHQRKK